jgi:hypothetical protein
MGFTQPRWGWVFDIDRLPRIAAWPQSWAKGWNPVGIPGSRPYTAASRCIKKDDMAATYSLSTTKCLGGVVVNQQQSKLPSEMKIK